MGQWGIGTVHLPTSGAPGAKLCLCSILTSGVAIAAFPPPAEPFLFFREQSYRHHADEPFGQHPTQRQ